MTILDENNNEENEPKKDDNSSQDNSDNNSEKESDFSAPPFPKIPPFIMDVVKNIERQVGSGFHFESVNVRVVGENDLHTLPNEVLQKILDKAVEEEQYELAVKVRDAINNKKDGK
jgi:hypothetical protein